MLRTSPYVGEDLAERDRYMRLWMIEQNKSQYQAYITQGTYKQEQQFQTYLAKMKKTGEWGDEVILRAVAHSARLNHSAPLCGQHT